MTDPIKRKTIDDRNQRIVDAARKDISLGFVELGQRFGVSRATARLAIKKLAPDVFEKMRGRSHAS